MNQRIIYSISDIHLGGEPNFQLCPPESHRRLAKFITTIAGEGAVELIINGDFIDFLAEQNDTAPKYTPFIPDPDEAAPRLQRIIDRCPEIFEAFRTFTRAGQRLTILLGNHDLEMAIPAARRELIRALTGDAPARYQFIHDGEAYRVGDALFEHGNRYDGWNLVMYDDLRQYLSRTSREETHEFQPPPGSRLVAEVMNPLKEDYRFIDLLKPENEAVLPILVALQPTILGNLKTLTKLVALNTKAKALQPRVGQAPAWPAAIAGTETADQRPLDLQDMQIAGGETGSTAALAWHLRRIAKTAEQDRPRALRDALIGFRGVYQSTFDIFAEADTYEENARRLAGDRDRVIVFGHTHLAKRFPLNTNGGTYINTGTWCPVIRLPERLYLPSSTSEAEAKLRDELTTFIEDLRHNRTARWTTLETTCARLVADETTGRITERELLRVRDDGSTERFEGYPEA